MAKYGFTYKNHMMYPDHYIIDADSLDDALQKIVPVGIDGMTQWHMQVIDFNNAIIKRIAMSIKDGEVSAVEVPDWTFGELTPYEYFEDPNGAAADIQARIDEGNQAEGKRTNTDGEG